jgi:tetratricopeptide (TPR) repeat protein
MFSTTEQKQELISQLSDKQIAFLTYNLFTAVLPQTPLLKFKPEELLRICDLLFPGKAEETARYINQLYEKVDQVKNFDQDPRFSQIVLRLHQLNQLNELFIVQKPLIDIQKRVFESIELSTTDTVYVTRIISNDTLESMESNIGKYISIGIFVLATKSLLTARTIARQAVNNGLTSVLFEIEAIRGTHLLNLDNDRVIFRLDAVFCLKSIDQAPDGVWDIKIKCVDKEFQLIKEQLEFEINVKLSWLTYGNYLYFLNRFEEGEAYFKYLLDKLSSEDIYQSAIYNNMGLLYAKKYEEKNHRNENDKEQYLHMAKTAYSKVLAYVKSIESSSTIRKNEDQPCNELSTLKAIPSNTTVDYSTVVGNIADLYYKANQYEEAMKSYMEALQLSADQQSSRYYQKMIVSIKEHLEKQKTNF